MYLFKKLFNKKISDRQVSGSKVYSISFINCKMRWIENMVLKKAAQKNYPTIDKIFMIPASDGQSRSDIVLKIFVQSTTDSINKVLHSSEKNISWLKNNKTSLMHVLGAFKVEGGNYQITDIDSVDVAGKGRSSLRVVGETTNYLESTKFSENVFLIKSNKLIIFQLIVMDKDEPLLENIKNDFYCLLESIKLA